MCGDCRFEPALQMSLERSDLPRSEANVQRKLFHCCRKTPIAHTPKLEQAEQLFVVVVKEPDRELDLITQNEF